jgi:hypothetical protein
MEAREQEFGPQHSATCQALAELAKVFKHQNRNAEAAQLLWRELEGRESVLGVGHPYTIGAMERLESIQIQEEGCMCTQKTRFGRRRWIIACQLFT